MSIKMTSVYLMFTALCVAGGVYFFHPELVRQYYDTVVVLFAALTYFLFIRPWLKEKFAVENISKDDIDANKKNE
ncbi:hypothetical protein [Halodesulfovibrio marinisediminis]|uniref:Uncharacterized protein n=1 Tax=Halodesulfovibrio marinisediminis DSM 17456 TaxID=1121457 RepID=A0A1N6E7K8_9BACT|nr:hypothetical protein [Halodesulfovibrio marinisediminis]SIN79004.1 hypothetical protein SAMN02745161_0771 [Halodesulfovibrio marinisediminis DSM 17456]